MRRTSCEIAIKKRALLVVVSGPSGVGKDAVLAGLKDYPFQRIVTATTRPPRPGETTGVHYHFLSPERFERMRQAGELLEYANVYGNWYGVPRAAVESELARGQDVVIKVDVQGAATIKKVLPQAILIYLVTPSMDELCARLKGRQTESSADIALRLKVADEEMKRISAFDYLVVNKPDAIQEAVADIRAILSAEKCRIIPGALCLPG